MAIGKRMALSDKSIRSAQLFVDRGKTAEQISDLMGVHVSWVKHVCKFPTPDKPKKAPAKGKKKKPMSKEV